MGDAAANENPAGSGGFAGTDRRRTVDLIRVERGEPERRKEHRDPKPFTEIGDSHASEDN